MFAQHGRHGVRRLHRNDTDQAAVPGRNNILHEKIICYSCQVNGHYSDQCTNQNGTNLAQLVLTLMQCCADIKHTWVLLVSCSTNRVSNNTGLVKEIITCKNHKKRTVSTNGGLRIFNKKETLKLFPTTIHFNQNSMETII